MTRIMSIVAVGAILAACGDSDEPIADERGAGAPVVETGRDRVVPSNPPGAAPGEVAPSNGLPAEDGFQSGLSGPGPRVTAAVARLAPTEGHSVQGEVRFELASAGLASAEMDGAGVLVTGTIEGLAAGKHGFHVHELGDCTAPDGASAGGHFNPDDQPHGGPDQAARHAGDLGNIEAAEGGSVTLDLQDDRLAMTGAQSIIGRALVVHAQADDLKSQPSGKAGARVACGVIGIAVTEPTGTETGTMDTATRRSGDATESDPMVPETPTGQDNEPSSGSTGG
ncbi:hypothetical protein BH24PSE2_BH24PSE2_01020 [soil metagenome]